MLALKILLVIMFDSYETVPIIGEVFFLVGLWKVFQKCGVPGWHVLIPGYRYYELSKCANREPEGRIIFVSTIVIDILNIIVTVISKETNLGLLGAGFTIALFIVSAIYYIRIISGLVQNFHCKKIWIPLWILVQSFAAIVWGFSSKYQPENTVPEMENKINDFFSNIKSDVMENGLTINLEDRSVNDFFKKKYLLRDIHMYIAPGSMVLLLGGSGAGKTTLVNAINGYEKANAQIVLNGKNVYDSYKEMQYEVGFVPQQDLMRGNDTVLHTLLDAAALRLPIEFSAERRRERVNEVMDIFGLSPVSDSLVDKLSGGQRKRLSIAMEFLSNPALFILDEPDSGLDGVMARELMQHLRKIADQGKIVIVITHTPDRVIDLFDSVIVLAKDSGRTGRLAYYGPISEARSFFTRNSMEEIVKSINRPEEGGDGLADEFIIKYTEVQHA